MFTRGTLKKVGILLTLAFLPFLLGYSLLTFIILSIIAFLLQFFRDPNRKAPANHGILVAPADGRIFNGKIDIIKTVHYSDPMMKHILEKDHSGTLVSTFMSPFDVHVNRAPISGKIVKTKYYPGKFKIASGSLHTENEKNLIVIDSEYGKVGVVQIAGFVARRIVQYVEAGDWIESGDRLGMIKFGSRVDVIIPNINSKILVAEGEKPKAGETIIAKMFSSDEISST
ncbi:MAG TPA: archaetidylserine decarboxylase [Methanobacteriaceae archaeon]|nr:archaetidylserine decarboxylase [Methanobacteriaceae archaeon]